MSPLMQTLATAACLMAWVRAEYTMDKEDGPALFYVHGRYIFFASEKSPDTDPPAMELHNFVIEAKKASATTGTPTLNVAMVPLRSFQQFVVDNVSMCTDDRHFHLDPKHGAVMKEITAKSPVTETMKLAEGGAHMLMVVNCNSNDEVTMTGNVRVKNSWGYLDALDYYRVPVYGCALGMTVITLLVYLFVLTQQEETIRDTQYYCLLLGCMSLMESALACSTLYMENEGSPGWGPIVEAVYLAKIMYGLTFMCQTVQGLGFTVHRLDWVTTAKCYVVVLVYVLAAMPKICILSIRPHLAIVDSQDIIKATLPAVIVTAVILCWLIFSLGKLMRELRKRDDEEAVAACKRIAGVFLFLMLFAAMTLVGQIFTTEKGVAKSNWKFAVWNDAVASATFGTIVIAMMYFSMENYVGKSLQMGQLPTNEGDVEDDGAPEKAAADEDDEEAIFGQGPPTADTIGARVE